MSKPAFYKSSVGMKMFMALTGAFLVLFMLVHLTVNLLVFGGADLYNEATHFMATNPFIQIMQPVLALGFIVHILYGLYLAIKNKQARPVKYVKKDDCASSSWASRYMWLTGIVILGVLALHLVNYFVKIQFTGLPAEWTDYDLVVNLFRDSVLYTILYIAWFVVLGIHLSHGFWSMFQSSGQAYVKWLPVLKVLAILFCLLVSVGFSSIAIYFGFIA